MPWLLARHHVEYIHILLFHAAFDSAAAHTLPSLSCPMSLRLTRTPECFCPPPELVNQRCHKSSRLSRHLQAPGISPGVALTVDLLNTSDIPTYIHTSIRSQPAADRAPALGFLDITYLIFVSLCDRCRPRLYRTPPALQPSGPVVLFFLLSCSLLLTTSAQAPSCISSRARRLSDFYWPPFLLSSLVLLFPSLPTSSHCTFVPSATAPSRRVRGRCDTLETAHR